MQPNPILRRLGLADEDRAVIIHTDDIGMCLSSVTAFAELWEAGIISSGAVMVPCPWFLKAAAFSREHPEADLGVHSTLTCEYDVYRWGAVSTRDPRSGLTDEGGFFYQTSAEVQKHADPTFVQVELETQVQQAMRMGMQPSHIDTHMGAIAALTLMPVYIRVAVTYRLPPLALRMDAAHWQAQGMDAHTAEMTAMFTRQLEVMGIPLLDAVSGLDLGRPDNCLEQAKEALAALEPGITHFILHPAKDSPELREITGDWRSRVANYETFLHPELREYIKDQGIQVIGYRALQELMPAPSILSALPF
jgi:predicted glycoside hydrolase/deacetylase ChbG (UPF0249 family)